MDAYVREDFWAHLYNIYKYKLHKSRFPVYGIC